MSLFDKFAATHSRELASSIGLSDVNTTAAEDLANKWFGTGLTSGQIEQNNFNAIQAYISRNWQERMSNTAYQRQVKDMQAAGVNPALLYGSGASGASTPSGAVATAGSNDNGMDFGQLVSALSFPVQLAQMVANVDNTKANTLKQQQETERTRLDNEFLTGTMNARMRSVELSNSLTEVQTSQIESSRRLIGENIRKVIAETGNEYERRFLIRAESEVARANAKQIATLLPLQENLLKAQTDHQKATALASYVHALYENHMLDAGYIETMIDAARDQARAALTGASAQYKMAEVNSAFQSWKNSVLSGDLYKPTNSAVANVVAKGLNGLLGACSALSTAIGGPLASLLSQ